MATTGGSGTSGGNSALDWANLAYSVYRDAQAKKNSQGKFVTPPESPAQEAIRTMYMGWLQPGGSPTQNLLQPMVLNNLERTNNLHWDAPKTIDVTGMTGMGGQTGYSGSAAHPFDFSSIKSATGGGTPPVSPGGPATPETDLPRPGPVGAQGAGALQGGNGGVGGVGAGASADDPFRNGMPGERTFGPNTDTASGLYHKAMTYIQQNPDVTKFGASLFLQQMGVLGLAAGAAMALWNTLRGKGTAKPTPGAATPPAGAATGTMPAAGAGGPTRDDWGPDWATRDAADWIAGQNQGLMYGGQPANPYANNNTGLGPYGSFRN